MLKKTLAVLLAVVMVCGMIPLSVTQAFAAEADSNPVGQDDEYPVLEIPGTTTAVFTEGESDYIFYKISPAEGGMYSFYSTGDHDTIAALYDSDISYLIDNDDNEGSNFGFNYTLEADKTYYLKLWLYSYNYDDDGKINVSLHVDKLAAADSLTITHDYEEIESYEGPEGTKTTLSYTLSPEDVAREDVTWTSSDESVATIEGNSYSDWATLTLRNQGTATITASIPSGASDTIEVTVSAVPTIAPGETKTVTINENNDYVRFKFVAPETKYYTFSSTGDYDTYGAFFDSDGDEMDDSYQNGGNFSIQKKFTKGETYYLATKLYDSGDGGETYQVKLEETPAAQSVEITYGDSIARYPGSYCNINAILLPEGCAYESITWSSSDPDIVSVPSYYGGLNFVAPGEATVTATSDSGLSDSISVTVKDYEPISLDTPVTVDLKDSIGFVAYKFTPSETAVYEFKSTDAQYSTFGVIGEIEEDGYLNDLVNSYGQNDFSVRYRLVAGHTYYLNAGSNYAHADEPYHATLTKAAAATGMSITQGDELSGQKGNSFVLGVKFTPDGCSEEDVTWESSDEEIVSVNDSGRIELIAEGEATITATSENGLTASILVTVTGYESIEAGETKTVDIVTPSSAIYYKFVPDETCTYTFYSSGNYDTVGTLYDSTMYSLESDDQSGEDDNYEISCELTAGETYYISSAFYSSDDTGSFDVTCVKRSAATAIAITQGETYSCYPNTTKQFTVTYTPANALPEEITWSSSDEDVLSFGYNGTAYTHKIGEAVITAETDSGLTATCTVTVKDYDTITLNEKKPVTLYSDDEKATYKFIPSADGEYFFESLGDCSTYGRIMDEDMNILTSGNWGGNGDGFKLRYELEKDKVYYMQATLDYGNEGSFELLVSAVPTADSISITAGNLTGIAGGSINLDVEFDPEDSLVEDVTWTSSNEDVATVNEYGKVSLISGGTAEITATTPSGLTDTVTVRVTATENIQANETKTVDISEPGEQKIYKFVPEETAQYAFYTSDDESNLYGALCYSDLRPFYTTQGGSIQIVRTLNRGTTYYFVCGYTEDRTGSYDVNLIKCPEAESVTISPSGNIKGYVGYSTTLKAELQPKFAVSEAVSWSSDDDSIAEVSDYGTVTFKKVGTATITATTESGLTASVDVTVKDYEPLSAGDVKDVDITSPGGYEFYKITPDEDGAYVFQTVSDIDTYGELYDSKFNLITEDDDGGKDNNFRIDTLLTGGKTYYLKARLFGNKTGSFTLTATKVPFAESMTIKQGTSIKAYPNTFIDLEAVFEPQNCYRESVSLSTSNSSVADIDEYGSVEFKAVGTATITATSERGLTATCTVNVVDYETLAAGETKTADIGYCGGEVVYKFIPDSDGRYSFTTNAKKMTNTVLRDENFDDLSSDSKSKVDLRENLEAGKTYYLDVSFNSDDVTGPVTVSAEEVVGVTSLTITSLPNQTTYVKGFPTEYNYDGLEFRAVWSDGEVTEWAYGDERVVRGERVNIWKDDATVTVSLGGNSDSFDFEFIDNPVDSIEIVDGLDASIVENTNGRWDTRYDPDTDESVRFFVYNTPDTDNVTAKINYKDGTSKTVKLSETVDGYSFICDNDQYKTPWTVGSANVIKVSYLGKTTDLYATITESPVQSIEALGTVDPIIVNTHGYWDERYNKDTKEYEDFYYYSDLGLYNVPVRIHYKDGSTKDVRFGEIVDGEDFSYSTDQYTTPWTVGGENRIDLNFMGATTTIYATLTESPVRSIEVLDGFTLTVIENVDGNISTAYNPDTGAYDREFFRYDCSGVRKANIRVNYKDGTTRIVHPYEEVNGAEVNVSTDQYNTPWTVGGENPITIEYLGATATITGVIVSNPVESITILQPTSKVFIENTDGYYRYNDDDEQFFYYYTDGIEDTVVQINYTDGTTKTANVNDTVDGYGVNAVSNQYEKHWTVGGENIITVRYMGREATMPVTLQSSPLERLVINHAPTRVYIFGDSMFGKGEYFMPDDISGLSFTAYFKNGTSKTYTSDDLDENGKFGGYGYIIKTNGAQTVGNNTVTFSYMGAEATYTVPVVENTTASVEVVKLPTNPVYSQYYSPDWRGTQIKITKTDGTSKTITLDDSNIIYGFDDYYGLHIAFALDGQLGRINSRYIQGNEEYVVDYLGKTCTVNGLTRRIDKEVVGVEVENFSASAKDMVVKITNADGTKETIVLDNIVDNRIGWAREINFVRALTPKGLLSFIIYNHDVNPDNENIMNIFGIDVKKDAQPDPQPDVLIGDVNGDKIVDILDAAIVQKYAAGKSTLTPEQFIAGDVNNDGSVDILDATQIQKYAAGKITEFKRKTA